MFFDVFVLFEFLLLPCANKTWYDDDEDEDDDNDDKVYP